MGWFRFSCLHGLAPLAYAGAVAGLSPSPARADPPREINSLATQMSPRISQCLIRRQPALIERWLRTLPGSAAESRLVRSAEPRFPACFGEPFEASGGVWIPKYDTAGVRAALVRALLQSRRSDLPELPPPPGGASAWYSGTSGPTASPEDIAALVAADLGACLAARHWREVTAMVRAVDPEAENSRAWGYRPTKAARDREAATVDGLLAKVIPSVPACVPAGAKVRINRLRLRTLLEEAALQMIRRSGTEAPFKQR
jgi:hypothetical protein